jgi:hypothetical protein
VRERPSWVGRFLPVAEEYHKAPETGCAIAQMQFTHADRLQPAIGLVSVVALLQLRDVGRQPAAVNRPARQWAAPGWVAVVAAWRYGDPDRELTVAEFIAALGRLGSHQTRPSDGPPGRQTLWRGWTQLQAMVQGVACSAPERWGGNLSRQGAAAFAGGPLPDGRGSVLSPHRASSTAGFGFAARSGLFSPCRAAIRLATAATSAVPMWTA